MRAIELWQWGGGEDSALSGLLAALHGAGIAVSRRAFLPSERAIPTPTLIWQHDDDGAARAGALVAGADEIVGPWMHGGEALARCLCHARRVQRGEPAHHVLRMGELEIDLMAREAKRRGRPLCLLLREYELLRHLAHRPGEAHSRSALLRAIWRLSFDPGTNVVEVHMSRLRAKLDRNFPWPMLRTMKGRGYALVLSEAEPII